MSRESTDSEEKQDRLFRGEDKRNQPRGLGQSTWRGEAGERKQQAAGEGVVVHRVCRTRFPRRMLSSVACATHRSLKMRMETSGLANWRLSVMVGGGDVHV